MRFTIDVTIGNAAMRTGDDVADTLEDVANVIHTQHAGALRVGEGHPIHDANGNIVGWWTVVE